MPSRPRVLIADDHTLIAELCKRILETEFDVVGIVSDGRAMVRAAIQQKPHVIVVDLAMPILNGLDAGCQVKEACPAVKLVFLTVNSDPEVAAEAFRRGGSAYVLKTSAASELMIAVREALRGNSYMSPKLPKDHVRYLQTQQRTSISEDTRLTERQREVLQLLESWSHGITVYAIPTDGSEAVQKARALKPDLVLLDLGLPTLNGIDAAKQIGKATPSAKIVFVTQNHDADVMGVLGPHEQLQIVGEAQLSQYVWSAAELQEVNRCDENSLRKCIRPLSGE